MGGKAEEITDKQAEEKKRREELQNKANKNQGEDKKDKLIEAKKREAEEAIMKKDKEQEKHWDDSIEALSKIQDVATLENKLLDLLLGLHRVTDSMERFPNLVNAFHTTEMQAKIIVKVIKNVQKAVKKIQLDKLPAEKQPGVRKFVVYFMCLIKEAFKSYGEKDLDGKGIKLLQEALISIGFRRSAEAIYA